MKSERFLPLDALRGLAILGMAWAGMLPDTLPAWMFHAQEPPPNHVFTPAILGITWVDLVFPFFLFSMGAAIPLSIGSRLMKGDGPLRVFIGLCVRGLLLATFAILGQHLRPEAMSNHPDAVVWWRGLLGFLVLAFIFVRWPKGMPRALPVILVIVGVVVAAWLISNQVYPDGIQGFANYRNDVILLVLANVAVSGGAVWLLSRGRPVVKLAVMALVTAVFLTHEIKGSVGAGIWNFDPLGFLDLDHKPYGRYVPVIYHFEYHKYLLIVIPGMLCGELLTGGTPKPDATTSEASTGKQGPAWRLFRLIVGVLAFACPVIACIGLFARQVPLTTAILAGLATLLVVATSWPQSRVDEILRGLARIGGCLVVIGLLCEPIGGGIRKDSPTLSYFLVTAGLAAFVLLALVVLDVVTPRLRVLKPLALTGANPILCYLLITNLATGIPALLHYSEFVSGLSGDPWTIAVLDGGVRTLAVGAVAALLASWKIYLRA